MKTCATCKVEKPHSEFHKSSSNKSGYQSRCKVCNKAGVVKWQAEYPDRYEENWRRNSYGDKALFRRKAARYGLTVEELQLLVDQSGGVCNICKNPPNKWLVVDHCHDSKRVRGILCESCNQGLGLFKDNIDSLSNAIKYLQA